MTGPRAIQERTVGFVRRLRQAGLPVGVDGSVRFAAALQHVEPTSASEVYHAARAALVFRREDYALFDRIFTEAWLGHLGRGRGQKMPVAPRHDTRAVSRTALTAFLAEPPDADATEIDVEDRSGSASWAEQLVKKDFAKMSEAELAAVKRALGDVRWQVVFRRTRRLQAGRRGEQLDMRAAMRRAAKRGGTFVQLPRKTRRTKQRPLLVLADISGSMALYSRILLHFFHGLNRRVRDVETFAFGTRLTRITPALALRDVDWALDAVAHEVVDFAGGTRIGECLETFERKWRRRVLSRGSVVVVVSDGLETGDSDVLEAQMQRLFLRCHRLVWLNPLLGGTTYEPKAEGMARAVRYVDDFLPVHNLHSLRALANHLAKLPATSPRKGFGAA